MAPLKSKLLSFFRRLSGREEQKVDASSKPAEVSLPSPRALPIVHPVPVADPAGDEKHKIATSAEQAAAESKRRGETLPPRRTSIVARKPIVDLVIGFDFGTSCSKVVISDQTLNRSYPITFRPSATGIERYLQPTVFFRNASGSSLEKAEGEVQTNLKLALLNAVESKDRVDAAVASVAIYMGLVLRKTLEWFNSRLLNNYRDKEICWALNIGFPGKQITPGSLLDAYTAAAKAACRSLAVKEPISLSLIRNLLSQELSTENSENVIQPERVSFYPEIAAQLAGYVKSPFHRVGPLLLVDVVAGTLDVSTLILHNYGQEDICSFHFCEVILKGAVYLFQSRLEVLNKSVPGRLRYESSAEMADPSFPIPEDLSDYLKRGEHATDHLKRLVRDNDRGFIEECRAVCRKNIVAFKAACQDVHAHGRNYHPFRKALPFILSGGGSRLRFYRELLGMDFEQSLISFTPWEFESSRRRSLGQGLQRVSFELPRDLMGDVAAADFDRLSVAHGLAYGADNLMKITGCGQSANRLTSFG